jgi:S1-C subfamily serine protease
MPINPPAIRTLSVFLVLGLGFAQPPKLTTPEEVARVEVIRKALPAIVKVQGTVLNPDTGKEGPGTGAGFFYSPSRIVTNFHVVDGLRDVRVFLNDGRSFPAQVFAVDKGIDLAILSVQGVVAPATLNFGSAQNLPVGMGLVVIGSPFGAKNLVSYGILSGIGALENEEESLGEDVGGDIGDVLYTDARVELGNSGGPMLDLQGRVVGVINAVLGSLTSPTGVGIGIPSDLVNQSIKDLERFGVPQRGSLRASFEDLDSLPPLLLSKVGLVSTNGAMIDSVEPDGPAERAGLRPAQRDARGLLTRLGDVIVAINDKPIKNKSDVVQTIARFRPGNKVKLTLWRDGRRLEASVTMMARR